MPIRNFGPAVPRPELENNPYRSNQALCRVLSIMGSGEEWLPMTDKNNASNEELRFEQTFDFAEPPAPIEVHAYSKRAGEIIVRGAANSQGALGARRVRRCA
jgi:hypothetical protein